MRNGCPITTTVIMRIYTFRVTMMGDIHHGHLDVSLLSYLLYIPRKHINYTTTESARHENTISRYVGYNSLHRHRRIVEHLLTEEHGECNAGIRPLYSVLDEDLR